jgi:hypothetical protein
VFVVFTAARLVVNLVLPHARQKPSRTSADGEAPFVGEASLAATPRDREIFNLRLQAQTVTGQDWTNAKGMIIGGDFNVKQLLYVCCRTENITGNQ